MFLPVQKKSPSISLSANKKKLARKVSEGPFMGGKTGPWAKKFIFEIYNITSVHLKPCAFQNLVPYSRNANITKPARHLLCTISGYRRF